MLRNVGLLFVIAVALLVSSAVGQTTADQLDSSAGRGLLRWRRRNCGRPGKKCCRQFWTFKKSCRKGSKCVKGVCKKEDDGGGTPVGLPGDPEQPTDSLTGEPCALKDQRCCSGAADEPLCVSGLVCSGDGPTNADNKCVPCGGLDELACRPQGFVLPGTPRVTCDEGLVPIEDDSGETFCRKKDTPPDPNQPTDSLDGKPCALEGQRCCSGAADEPLCVSGLICDGPNDLNVENKCVPCGGLNELACQQQGFGPAPEKCNKNLTPVEDPKSGKEFCRKAVEPSCPGLLGEPCCPFIADASPCGAGVICSTKIPGKDQGKPVKEGTCVSCGGKGEFACFEISIAGPSGPICDPGLSANEDEFPKCVVGGTGPPCTGVLCPPADH